MNTFIFCKSAVKSPNYFQYFDNTDKKRFEKFKDRADGKTVPGFVV